MNFNIKVSETDNMILKKTAIKNPYLENKKTIPAKEEENPQERVA